MLHLDSLPLEPEHADTVPRRVAPAAPRRAPPLAGEAPSMQRIRRLIDQVAAHDTTVLITGESGTGKEVIAQQIHACSARADKPFVAVNCGAIPAELLESELFGHEKGAFTGAITTRKGRFELAEGGTLFLDEVGDMPRETQSKILRVLVEQEFERVGGVRRVNVDVRIISSTAFDLEALIAEDRQIDRALDGLRSYVARIDAVYGRGEGEVGHHAADADEALASEARPRAARIAADEVAVDVGVADLGAERRGRRGGRSDRAREIDGGHIVGEVLAQEDGETLGAEITEAGAIVVAAENLAEIVDAAKREIRSSREAQVVGLSAGIKEAEVAVTAVICA